MSVNTIGTNELLARHWLLECVNSGSTDSVRLPTPIAVFPDGFDSWAAKIQLQLP